MLNLASLIATLERAADTLEQLEPVLNPCFEANAQVAALRVGAQALASNPSAAATTQLGQRSGAVPARVCTVPAKPTKAMLLAAHHTLLQAGHTVTFETVKALYLGFLAEAPATAAVPEPSTGDAPAAYLAPFSG